VTRPTRKVVDAWLSQRWRENPRWGRPPDVPGARLRVAEHPAESYTALASSGGLLDAPKLRSPRNPRLR
jgi:hypothetical protein